MSSSPITLREYLEQYSKIRKNASNSQGDNENDTLNFLEENIAAIKIVLSGKVNSTVYNSISSHLDQIKDLFKLSFNKKASLNESVINIRCTQTKNRLKTHKTMKCSLRREESMPEISMGFINEPKSIVLKQDTLDMANTKTSSTSFTQNSPVLEIKHFETHLRVSNTKKEKKEEKERKIFFNLPPRLERKMNTEIEDSDIGVKRDKQNYSRIKIDE